MSAYSRKAALAAGCAVVALCAAGAAQASGFAIKEQSTTYQGTSFAGATAGALDATTIFFNPAGMTELPGRQTVSNGAYIMPSSEFSGSASFAARLGGGAVSGDAAPGDMANDAFVPSFYGSWEAITDTLWVGIGITAPWGLATEYPSDWVGRYQATYSSLTTYNFQPSLAWKVTPKLSLGAGLQIQYAESELSQAVDFASIIDASTGLALYSPGSLDGVGTVKGNDWSLGYTLGALYKIDDSTRIGASFRSAVDHTLTGEATTSGVPSVSTLVALFAATGATADLTTPAIASAGVYHQINKQWAVMADVSWTEWSNFKTLTVEYDNVLRSDTVTEEYWEDSFFFALGVSYKPADDWTLRAGVAYDQSPVPDAYRTARIPDSDRYWLSIGLAYDVSRTVSIGAAYTHIFADDASVSLTDDLTGTDAFRSSLAGLYSNSVDIVSMQVKVVF